MAIKDITSWSISSTMNRSTSLCVEAWLSETGYSQLSKATLFLRMCTVMARVNAHCGCPKASSGASGTESWLLRSAKLSSTIITETIWKHWTQKRSLVKNRTYVKPSPTQSPTSAGCTLKVPQKRSGLRRHVEWARSGLAAWGLLTSLIWDDFVDMATTPCSVMCWQSRE